MSQELRLSVVMATYNRAETLKSTLQHLIEQDLEPSNFELIVVDDGSSDNTYEVIETWRNKLPFHFTYLRHSNHGPGYTQNRGIEVARAPIVLLIADDIQLSAGALNQHLAMHEKYTNIEYAILGQVRQPSYEKSSVFLQKWDPFGFKAMEGAVELPYYRFWACNISFKREFMTRAGMFLETRGKGGAAAHEDVALGYLLSKSGLRIFYCPEALGFHEHIVTLETACRRGYEQGLNFPDLRNYIGQPEISVIYHYFGISTLKDHFRAWFGERQKYLPKKDKNPIRLLCLYLIRNLAFNFLTVHLFWLPLVRSAESMPSIAPFMRSSFYRGIISYHFFKGCRDAENSSGAVHPQVTPENRVLINSDEMLNEHEQASTIAGTAFLTLFGAIIGAVLTFINEIFAARFLGSFDYGAFGVAVAMVKIGEIIATFGSPLTVLRFLPIHVSKNEKASALGVILGGAIAPILVGSSLAYSGFHLREFIANDLFHKPVTANWIAILIFAIPLLATSDFFGNVARGFGKPLNYVASRNLIPSLTSLAAIIILWIVEAPHLGVAYSYVLGAAIGCITAFLWSSNLTLDRLGLIKPKLSLTSFYACATPIALNAIITVALLWGDVLILALMSDTKSVGIYRGCTQISLCFDMVLHALAASTAPIYAVMNSNENYKGIQQILNASVRLASILLVPLVTLITLNASDLLQLLGEDFVPGTHALSILAICQFLKVTFAPASVLLVMSGKQNLEMINSIISVLMNTGLNFILIPLYGLDGAAAATGTSLIILSLLRFKELKVLFKLNFFNLESLKIFVILSASIALVTLASILMDFGTGSGVTNLFLRIMISVLVVIQLIWSFILDNSERQFLKTQYMSVAAGIKKSFYSKQEN